MTSPAPARRFIAYLRVSTGKQEKSGLGLQAQRHAVTNYLRGIAGASLLREFVEVESGKVNTRPKLQAAMEEAKLTGASLVIAKLDRLSRNAHFLTGLAERGVKFVACDMPDANEFTVTIMAALAQQERKMISERTRDALAAAKAKGTKLGNPNGAQALHGYGNAASVAAIKAKADARAALLRKRLEDIKSAGHFTLSAIAKELDRQQINTPRGGNWSPMAVSRLLQRTSES